MSRNELRAILLALIISPCAHASAQNQELLQAAEKGLLAEAQHLLAKGADKNAETDDGTTALMLAAAGGHTDIVRLLLDAGADVDASNGAGKTALMASAARGDTAVMLLLLDAGANVNAKSETGDTALEAAKRAGKSTATLILLEAGAQPTDDTGLTPIRLAEPGVSVMRGRPDRVPDNRITIRERPPLVDAAARGDAKAVRALLDAGADVNAQEALLGLTALDMAKLEGHTEVVAILLEAGARGKKR